MKIKIQGPKSDQPEEGIYEASVTAAGQKKKDDKKIELEFTIETDSSDIALVKEYPASLEPDSALFRDAKVLMGTKFKGEIGLEFDLDQLVGLEAPVIVQRRIVAGGREQAVVAVVLERTLLQKYYQNKIKIPSGAEPSPVIKTEAAPVAA